VTESYTTAIHSCLSSADAFYEQTYHLFTFSRDNNNIIIMQTLPPLAWDWWLIRQQPESQQSTLISTAAYIFQPISVQNLGPINASARDFISNLG